MQIDVYSVVLLTLVLIHSNYSKLSFSSGKNMASTTRPLNLRLNSAIFAFSASYELWKRANAFEKPGISNGSPKRGGRGTYTLRHFPYRSISS